MGFPIIFISAKRSTINPANIIIISCSVSLSGFFLSFHFVSIFYIIITGELHGCTGLMVYQRSGVFMSSLFLLSL
jgi:hypothetical protein